MAQSKFSSVTKEQKVVAFRKRMLELDEDQDGSESSTASSSKRSSPAVLLAGEQEKNTEASTPPKLANANFTEHYQNSEGTTAMYMNRLKEMEYNEKTRDEFFHGDSQEDLVTKFGYTLTYKMRLGLDRQTQGFKLYIRKENLRENPTVASIIVTELKEILGYIKDTLKQIDQSIERKEGPLYHYGPKEIRNPRNPNFWEHDDAYLTTSMTARMRFMHVKNDRYQFSINSPIVLDSTRFKDYLGPILNWCRADLDEFILAVDCILQRVDPAEL